MAEKLGIEHLKNLAKVGFGIATLADNAAVNHDAFAVFADVKKGLDLLPDVKDVMLHFSEATAELKDLDDAERTELYTYAISQLDFPQEKVSEVIEKALLTACKLHEIVLLWKPATADADATPAPKAKASAPTEVNANGDALPATEAAPAEATAESEAQPAAGSNEEPLEEDKSVGLPADAGQLPEESEGGSPDAARTGDAEASSEPAGEASPEGAAGDKERVPAEDGKEDHLAEAEDFHPEDKDKPKAAE